VCSVRGADLLQPLQPGQIAIHVDGDQTSQNQLVQLTVTDGTGKVDKLDMNSAGGPNVQHSCEAPGAWSSDKTPARTVVCHIQTLPTAPDNWYRVDFHEEMAREDSSLQYVDDASRAVLLYLKDANVALKMDTSHGRLESKDRRPRHR
jgi:hypothetical protein